MPFVAQHVRKTCTLTLCQFASQKNKSSYKLVTACLSPYFTLPFLSHTRSKSTKQQAMLISNSCGSVFYCKLKMLLLPDFCPLLLSSSVWPPLRLQFYVFTVDLKTLSASCYPQSSFGWTCACLAFCLYLLLALTPLSHFHVWGRCKCLSRVCWCSWLKTAGGHVLCFRRLLICLSVPNWRKTSWDIDNGLLTIFSFTHRLGCQKGEQLRKEVETLRW